MEQDDNNPLLVQHINIAIQALASNQIHRVQKNQRLVNSYPEIKHAFSSISFYRSFFEAPTREVNTTGCLSNEHEWLNLDLRVIYGVKLMC